MTEFIQTSISNGVAVVNLRRRPEPALDAEIRAALLDALVAAADDPDVTAILLASEFGALVSDIPIQERLEGQARPSVAELCAWIEASPKPVVATLRGRVFDAGFELVLAAHFRVAQQSARVRLTTLKSGVLPCPQTVAKLASVLGAEASLRLLDRKESLSVADPMLAPLFASVVGQNAVGQAGELARSLAHEPLLPAATPGLLDPLAYQNAIRVGRAKNPQSPEHRALVDALEAAQLLPKPALLAFIAEQNDSLAKTPESAAKAYETCCKQALLTPHGPAQPAKRITLVGTGALARNITLAALGSGVGVDVLSLTEGGFEAHKKAISEAYGDLVKRQHLSEAQARSAFAGMGQLPSLDGTVEAEFVIECGAKSVEQISQLAGRLRAQLGAEVPLLLTAGMRHGAHRFSNLLDAHTAGGYFHFARASESYVEIALHNTSLTKTARNNAFAATLQQIGLPVVVQKAQDGLASARVLTAYLQGVEECLALGASFEQVERALSGCLPPFAYQNAEGFRLQPFRVSTFFKQDETAGTPPTFSDYMLRAGFEGRDTSSALEPLTSAARPEAKAVLAAWRDDVHARTGLGPRALSDAEVRQIVDAALYCTAAQLLSEGFVRAPWELDFLTCATLEAKPGYGGPFHRAEARGLLEMRSFLREFTPLRPVFFQVPNTLDDMIKTGARYLPPYQAQSTRF